MCAATQSEMLRAQARANFLERTTISVLAVAPNVYARRLPRPPPTATQPAAVDPELRLGLGAATALRRIFLSARVENQGFIAGFEPATASHPLGASTTTPADLLR